MSAENQIANTATGTAATTGAVSSGLTFAGFLSDNALTITISCTVLSLIVAIIFHYINYRTNRRRLQLQRADKISQWLDDGKTHKEIEYLLDLAKDFK